jgi:signal transduction histidine kinase
MIKISYNLADDLPLIQADPTQMEQVILNLGSNAQDAMPEGGKLIFETQQVILDEDYCRQHLEVRPGPYVLLEVTDNGLGMDVEVKKKLFTSFYSTKASGAGVGLPLCREIVEAHGGTLRIQGRPGGGTVVSFRLPAGSSSP